MPLRILSELPAHFGVMFYQCEEVSIAEVVAILNRMPCKCSPLDIIPTVLLKQLLDIFGTMIARLASLSFAEGKFPDSFKTAQITPLLKKPGADPEVASNYRPISNLNTISKVLEKIFLARLQPILCNSRNFCKLQSAYRQKHSTETALLKVFDDCFMAMDMQRGTVLVTLDISAAFDTIVHDILLHRLELSFGIAGKFLEWIRSYLLDRKQFVKIGDSVSATVNLTAGVPQGSVLGPLLFCAYVSAMSSVIPQNVLYHQYADDTQLYCSVSVTDLDVDVNTLQECTKDIEYWFLTNGMLLNADKSDVILVSTVQQENKLRPETGVQVAGINIALFDKVRSLGVIIDKRLSLNSHVNSVCSSCRYHIKALRHIRPSLSTEIASTVARSIVMSRLDYCNSLLFGVSASNIKKLQRIQNSLARIVMNKPFRSDAIPLLYELHWLPIEKRIKFKLSLMVFKCLHDSAPTYLQSLLSEHRM